MNMTVDRLGQKHLAKAANLASADKLLFHNALREHYIFKVLHSGMVTKIHQPCVGMDLYALVRMFLLSPTTGGKTEHVCLANLVHAIEVFATLDAQFPPCAAGARDIRDKTSRPGNSPRRT